MKCGAPSVKLPAVVVVKGDGEDADVRCGEVTAVVAEGAAEVVAGVVMTVEELDDCCCDPVVV